MKRLVLPFLAGVLVGALIGSLASCPDSAALAKWKVENAELKRIAAADHAIHEAEIAALQKNIEAREAEEATLKAEATANKRTIASQAQTIAALQAAEPATTPEIEAMPIVISLRAQVRELTVGFNLAQATIATQDETIKRLELDKVDLAEQRDKWKADYESEYRLRLNCEKGLGIAEKQIKSSKFWRTTAIVAGTIALGAAITK